MNIEKMKPVAESNELVKNQKHFASVLHGASAEKVAQFLKNGNRDQKKISQEIDQEIALIDVKISGRESALHATSDSAGEIVAKASDVEKYQKKREKLLAEKAKYADGTFHDIDQDALREYINARKGENISGKKEELQELQKEITRLRGIVDAGENYESKKQFDASDIAQGKFDGEKKKLEKYEKDAKVLTQDIEEAEKIASIATLLENSASTQGDDGSKAEGPENGSGVNAGERTSRDTDLNEEEKFDREVNRRKDAENRESSSRDTDMHEEEKFDREVNRRDEVKNASERAEGSRDTDMTEEEKFDREVNRRAEAHGAKTAEIKNEVLEQLRVDIAQKREIYMRKDISVNASLAKLRKFALGHDDTEAQKELQIFRDEYESACKKLDQFLTENYQNLSPEDQKTVRQDIAEGRLNESVLLQEQRTKIKAENVSAMGKYLSPIARWASNKTVQKALAIGSVGLGVISGSVRTMLQMAPKVAMKFGAGETTMSTLKGVAALGKFLAPIGAGVAVGMGTTKLVEKWQSNRLTKEKATEKKAFENMTEEEQFLHLMDFDYKNIVGDVKRKEAITRNARLAGLITGAIAGGSVFMLMGGDTHGINDIASHDAVVHAPDKEFLDNLGKPLLAQELKDINPEEVQSVLHSIDDAQIAENAVQNAQESIGQSVDRDSLDDLIKGVAPDQTPVGDTFTSLGEQPNIPADPADTSMAEQNAVQNENVQSVDDNREAPTPQNEDLMKNESWHDLKGIVVDPEGVAGVLTVKAGSSVIKTIREFLENGDNHTILTEGKMGWDPAKYENVHEWARARAVVLANEYREAHPGVDIDHIQPGTKIKLDLHNLGDIKPDVELAGSSHVVPEEANIQTEAPHAVEQDVSNAEVVKDVNTKEDIQKIFGMDNDQYKFFATVSADKYVDELMHANGGMQTPMDQYLINLAKENHADFYNKTVEDVLRSHEIDFQGQTIEQMPVASEEIPIAPTSEIHNEGAEVKEGTATGNAEENVVRRSPNADDFVPKEGDRVMTSAFTFTPESSADDITKELMGRGIDEDAARKMADGYKRDLSGFSDHTQQRIAMRNLNTHMESYLSGKGGDMHDILKEKVVDGGEHAVSESVEAYAKMDDIEIMNILRERPDFDQKEFMNTMVGAKIQKTFGLDSLAQIKNIAGTKLDLFLTEGSVEPNMQTRLAGIVERAKQTFGDEVGSPGKDATVQSYFTRIAARAEAMHKTDAIFPPQEFKL
ncbi:MAG: hypothetical protein WC819_03210 [Parcubacteria group bacterium]|jgi:hypothetical protein